MKRVDKSIADLILDFLSQLKISEQWFLIILSSVVGVGGAFGAIIFRELISFFQLLFFDFGEDRKIIEGFEH